MKARVQERLQGGLFDLGSVDELLIEQMSSIARPSKAEEGACHARSKMVREIRFQGSSRLKATNGWQLAKRRRRRTNLEKRLVQAVGLMPRHCHVTPCIRPNSGPGELNSFRVVTLSKKDRAWACQRLLEVVSIIQDYLRIAAPPCGPAQPAR